MKINELARISGVSPETIRKYRERGLLDPFGGREDLAAGVIRAVGVPEERFAEDALRVLRAVRFACRMGFDVEPATHAALVASFISLSTLLERQ